MSHLSKKKGWIDWQLKGMMGFTVLVEPSITIVSYDSRSPRGQAISSLHKGQRDKERERVLFAHGAWVQSSGSGDLSTVSCLSLTQCMLGKAHAGKLQEHLLWGIDSGSCFHRDTDTENGQDICGSKVHVRKG